MRHLLAKDVRLVVPYLWLIVPAHVLWCAQAFLAPEAYFWMTLAAAITWTASIVMIEWQLETDRFVASLPVTRAAIVKARYGSALGGLALGAVLFVVYGHGIAAVATERVLARWHGSPSWASADGVTALLLVGYVLIVAFLPFYFRFGLPYGASWFAASAAVAIVVATGSARLANPMWTAGRPPSGIVRGWVAALAASWGIPLTGLALLAGAAGIGAASVWLSARFYQEREL